MLKSAARSILLGSRVARQCPAAKLLPQRRPSSTTAQEPLDQVGTTTENSKAVERTVMQKFGRATATGGYAIVVAGGIALVGVVFWALGSNLFFETRYLNEAVDLAKADPEVKR